MCNSFKICDEIQTSFVLQGLNVHDEERSKGVPVLSNSVYGHRIPLEYPTREHVRVAVNAVVKREFYRSCGTNMVSS